MKRFFKAIVKCLDEAVETMSKTDAYGIDHPASSMGIYRMF